MFNDGRLSRRDISKRCGKIEKLQVLSGQM